MKKKKILSLPQQQEQQNTHQMSTEYREEEKTQPNALRLIEVSISILFFIGFE